MVSPLLGAGAALASTFIPNMKVWAISNLDAGGEIIQGQFEPQGSQKEIQTTWGQFTSMNRQDPILNFLHGNAPQFSFTGRFFANNAFDRTPEEKLNKLEKWSEIDSKLRRPPILQFAVGDGHISINCVIVRLSIRYGRPGFAGSLRDVSFDLSLMKFSTFSLDDEEQTDTRFFPAKDGDYYELIAYYEYRNPLLGDIIRKNHPQYQRLQAGNVVKLPSIEGIRKEEVTQTSVPLKTAFGKRDTAQKRLRLHFFDLRSADYVSHLLQPSTTPAQ